MSLQMVPAPRDMVETVGKGDVHYAVDNYFGSVVETADGPQVFHVHQQAGDITSPHFHKVPQFQIFTGGGGDFGRARVTPPALHYADAWTAYGPIVAGADGIDYFTARVHSDVGAGWMPEARKDKRKSGRHFTVELAGYADGGAAVRRLIERHDDGLAAYLIELQPNETAELPAFDGSGRLITVLGGGVSLGDETFGRWAWGHVGPGHGPTFLTATSDGALVVCCDFPKFACAVAN